MRGLLVAFLALACLSSCAGREDVTQAPASLSGLQALRQSRGDVVGADEARRQREAALRDSAATLGARHGYVLRMRASRALMKSHESLLSRAFDYASVMRLASEGEAGVYLLPPAIRALGAQVDVEDAGRVVEMADQTYEIVRRAVLVGAAPSWRDFLLRELPERLEIPPDAMLPGNARERRQWRQWVADGWMEGIRHADREMQDRIHALRMDYVGVVRYLRLVEEGKVRPALADSLTVPVAADEEDGRMAIRRTMHRIVDGAEFNTSIEEWTQRPLDARGSLRGGEESDR